MVTVSDLLKGVKEEAPIELVVCLNLMGWHSLLLQILMSVNRTLTTATRMQTVITQRVASFALV